ncbi:MAG TPA: DUF2252 family protein [Puia sp.]|nr:DUF2252 family protein [Puia sp.]
MHSITDRITQFNADRVQQYCAIKYRLMAENAFRFFRGTCHLFYEDLNKTQQLTQYPVTWICGDLHLENFGSYKGDNRLVYFDLNDFDEAILAPASWELSRMATSIFVGFETLGIELQEATQMCRHFTQVYSTTLAKGKSRYIEPQTAKGIVRDFLDRVRERRIKVILRQRTVRKKGQIKFNFDKVRLFKVEPSLKGKLIEFINNWLVKNDRTGFEILDGGFRIAGTGSIGVKRYVFLLRKTENTKKYLFLDMKQAMASSLAPYADVQQPQWSGNAQRVVAVQQRMQNVSPALLGAAQFNDESYAIKEMQPTADKIDFMVIRNRFNSISRVIEDMAVLTASAQLRSAGRQGSAIADELIAFGKDATWQKPLIEYAKSYAAQVKKDYRDFVNDYNKGLLKQ